jgi:hypothetical protein
MSETYGARFKMLVVYDSTLMAVAYGRSAKDAALNSQIIPAKQLEALTAKWPRRLPPSPSPRKRAFVVCGWGYGPPKPHRRDPAPRIPP